MLVAGLSWQRWEARPWIWVWCRRVLAEDLDAPLEFGEFEPLVCALQETPLERLQPFLADKLRSGTSLKTLVAGAALANARTFGGEDYIGFHTFMALAPRSNMSAIMPAGSEALPVFKVLYRNTSRIHDFGGRDAEVLHALPPGTSGKSSGSGNVAVHNSQSREPNRLRTCSHRTFSQLHKADWTRCFRRSRTTRRSTERSCPTGRGKCSKSWELSTR